MMAFHRRCNRNSLENPYLYTILFPHGKREKLSSILKSSKYCILHTERRDDIFTQFSPSKNTREMHKSLVQSKTAKIFCYITHITYMHCKETSQSTFETSHTTRYNNDIIMISTQFSSKNTREMHQSKMLKIFCHT